MSSEVKGQLPEGDDLLAAEYVLGVQSAELRAILEGRLNSENDFARLVLKWETLLSPFNDEYESIVLPAYIKKVLDGRLFPSSTHKTSGLWNSLLLWRGLAFGALALSAFIIGPTLLKTKTLEQPESIFASLQADTGDVRFVTFYEIGSNEIRISKVSSEKANDRDYELWLIEADGVPQSMGVIPNQGSVRLTVSNDFIAKINAGDTFAVSIEPIGGSPTGKVTGPVIAVGASNVI